MVPAFWTSCLRQTGQMHNAVNLLLKPKWLQILQCFCCFRHSRVALLQCTDPGEEASKLLHNAPTGLLQPAILVARWQRSSRLPGSGRSRSQTGNSQYGWWWLVMAGDGWWWLVMAGVKVVLWIFHDLGFYQAWAQPLRNQDGERWRTFLVWWTTWCASHLVSGQ